MTTDRELLELAAKAAGYDTSHVVNPQRLTLTPPVNSLWVSDDDGLVSTAWNPLIDNGDAFRLAAKLMMEVRILNRSAYAEAFNGYGPCSEQGDDRCAAGRRAIVRAAAEIGAKS